MVYGGASTALGFVGRDREMAELIAGLDDAKAGRGRLFLLGGDPGIGKSRLADETSVQAQMRGFRVGWGRCWEAGGAPVFWPSVQSLRSFVRGVDPEALQSQLGNGAPYVAQILPEIAEVLPDVGSPAPMSAEDGRSRAVTQTTVALSGPCRTRDASRSPPGLIPGPAS